MIKKLVLLAGAPNQIVMQREFDAPRHLVVQAMTTPELIKRWLGGKRAEVTSAEVDLRVGGRYRYVFRRPDGGEFSFSGEYREVSETRVVHTERFDGQPGGSLVTSTFTETSGRTTLHIVVEFDTKELRDMVAEMGMTDGAGESYDTLEALVRSL